MTYNITHETDLPRHAQPTKEQLAEIAAFAVLRPKLELAGVVFFNVGAGGGDILLENINYGACLKVLGDAVTLRMSRYTNDGVAVKPELVPEFVRLFERNGAKVPA